MDYAGCWPERPGGLGLRLLDAKNNSVYSGVITNPGDGGTWSARVHPGVT